MTLPTGARGRLVAAALLLIVLLVLGKFVVGPIIDNYFALGDDIAEIQDDIRRYRNTLAELPALNAAVQRLEQEDPLSPLLLTGANPALAAAAVQRRLQDVAEQQGIRIVSVHIQNPSDEGPLERITVQARLQANDRGLRDALYAVEQGTPYLFVDAISINKNTRRRNASAEDLDVRLTLSGLRTKDSQRSTGEGND